MDFVRALNYCSRLIDDMPSNMAGSHIFPVLCLRKHMSFPFDEYCYLLNEYYSKEPHPAVCCCSHRAFPARCLSLNSRYFNMCSWSSICHCCMSPCCSCDGNPLEPCYLFQKRIDGRRRQRRASRDTYSMASEGKRILISGRSAEAMLDLFSEEVSEKYYCCRYRNGHSCRHNHQKTGGNECYARRNKHVTPSLKCTHLTESDTGPESETQFEEKEEMTREEKRFFISGDNYNNRDVDRKCPHYRFSSCKFEGCRDVCDEYKNAIEISRSEYKNGTMTTLTSESELDCKNVNKKFDYFSEGHCRRNSVCVAESHADGIGIRKDEEKCPRTKLVEVVGNRKKTRTEPLDTHYRVYGSCNNEMRNRSLPSVGLGESIELKLIEKTNKVPGISKSVGGLSDLGGSSKVHSMATTYSKQHLRSEEDTIISENTVKKKVNKHLATSIPSSQQHSDTQKVHEEISNTITSSCTSRNNVEVTNLTTIQDMDTKNYERGQWEFQHLDSRSDIKQSNEKSQISGSDASKVHSPEACSTSIMTTAEGLKEVPSSYNAWEQQGYKSDEMFSMIRYRTHDISRLSHQKTSRSGDRLLESSEGRSQPDQPVGDRISLPQVEETPLIPADISNFHQSTLKDASISQDSLNMADSSVAEKGNDVKEDGLNLQSIVSNLQSQSIGRSPVYTSSSNWSEAQDTGFETSQWQSSLQEDEKLEFCHEIQQQGPLSPRNVLSSTYHFDKSSRSYVDEFMEKVKSQLPTSEIQAKQGEISSSQYRTEGRNEDKKIHTCKEFGAQGPSIEQMNKLEFEDPKALESTFRYRDSIIRKSSRSFWNIISYIFGTRRSSHEISCLPAKKDESSFSINPNQASGKGVMDEQRELFAGDQGEVGETSTQAGSIEANTSYSSPNLKTHSSTKGMSMASCSEIEARSYDSVMMELITTPINEGISDIGPFRTEEILDTGRNSSPGRGSSVKQIEPPTSEGEIKLQQPNTETKHAELKRRKLQKSKQVLKDRFEEWEEVYKLEKQQQQVDEVFMREALLEAKKAADSWEVPVGAVLVRDGKIIARGCNLVEDLRDSTAHAEMLCIREASSLLRTWRLAGTTLYVTLEPCPMCAGAILQARIDTLVWGTPNKLLGADGSWIRLFPEGIDDQNEERMDMPSAPIHPLHPKMTIRRGVLAPECADAVQNFFERRRKKTKNPSRLPIAHPSKFISRLHDIFHVFFCL